MKECFEVSSERCDCETYSDVNWNMTPCFSNTVYNSTARGPLLHSHNGQKRD